MKIMIDMDDVLTNFNKAFLILANEMFGTPVDIKIENWDFWKSVPRLSLNMEEKIWERITATENFYETLPLYASEKDLTRLREILIDGTHEIYFVTSRFPVKGRSVQYQSQKWLQKYLGTNVSVIVNSSKGELCRLLGIDFAIDDAPHHIDNLLNHGITTYIIDWPYNRFIDHRLRVSSLGEFFDCISI